MWASRLLSGRTSAWKRPQRQRGSDRNVSDAVDLAMSALTQLTIDRYW